MKKFFFCAAAAIVALASCSKTQVVYNNAPEEIGFKAVTGAITKTEQKDATLDGTMGVFAFVTGGTTAYFENISFSNKSGDVWTGTTESMYWPVTSGLDFAVYAPWESAEGAEFETNTLTVKADNSAKTTIDAQEDYLYGAAYYNNSGSGFDKNTVSVPVTLKHAQAKVTVSFTGENVTITDVKLTAPVLKGSYAVTYTDPVTVDWTPGEANEEVSLIASATLSDAPSKASLMVVPETKTTITFFYQIDGSDAKLPYTITPSANWAYGTHYTYNVEITPKEIKFSPTVVPSWETGATTDTEL